MAFNINLRGFKKRAKSSEENLASDLIKKLTDPSGCSEAPFLVEKLLLNSKNASLKTHMETYSLYLSQFEALYIELNQHFRSTQHYLEQCLQQALYKRLHCKFIKEIKFLVKIKQKLYYLTTLCSHITPKNTYEFLLENHRVKYRLELFHDWLSHLNPPVDLKEEAQYFRTAIDKIYSLLQSLRETVKTLESLESYL